MKNVLASILLMTFVVSQANAGPAGKGQGPGMNARGPRMAQLQQTLGLTQAQVEQIRSIREQGGGREEVQAVLNEEQLERLEQHRAARRAENPNAGARPRDGRGRARGPGRGPGTNGPGRNGPGTDEPEPDDGSG